MGDGSQEEVLICKLNRGEPGMFCEAGGLQLRGRRKMVPAYYRMICAIICEKWRYV